MCRCRSGIGGGGIKTGADAAWPYLTCPLAKGAAQDHYSEAHRKYKFRNFCLA